LIFDLIEHPYFQRLRRIKQLGLSCLVYPGANHTRFEHALGALHLTRIALDVLISKGVDITPEEAEAVSIAVLLHDIGHGPFSHALEHTLIVGVSHENMSLLLMEKLNLEFGGRLDTAIDIFRNSYEKKFLHQLVAGQLDVDRLDYLRRDSFFSGVVEGTIGSDRILKMLNVKNDVLVVEYKGIYSVEKFLIARRLMYWQVYLHKTVLVAEHLLIKVLQRANELAAAGIGLFAPPRLKWFLQNTIDHSVFENHKKKLELIDNFIALDDSDIICSMKEWCLHPDRILSFLANSIINRKLFRIKIGNAEISRESKQEIEKRAIKYFSINREELNYFVFDDKISNNIYQMDTDEIVVLEKNGTTKSIGKASDIDMNAISGCVEKHFICYPKELDNI
jgi:HD superfamily phosphohydrolase